MSSRKVAVLTSGGDSPAMNAAVYGFLSSASSAGWDVFGVIDGYRGLCSGDFQKLNVREYRKNVALSGTSIGSSRFPCFKEIEVREKAVAHMKSQEISGLFVIGGDGSYIGASLLDKMGVPVVAAPGTIDNDVASSHYTIGYFSALEEIVQSVRKIKATSDSHSQVTFVEVMGRYCHDLSVAGAISSVADYVVTNKSLKTQDELISIVKEMISSGKKGIVILVTEKVFGPEHGFNLPSLKDLCVEIESAVGRQTRFSVLGYTQRGAHPTSWDIYVAQRFGIKAFELISKGNFGVSIGFDGNSYYTTNLQEAISMPKKYTNDLVDFVNSSYRS